MRAIARTPEFLRIDALPRRKDRNWEEITAELTDVLKTRYGTWKLRPIQAQALIELAENGGLFAPIPVGGGKTLIFLLAPYVLELKRPLLLMPASLIEKVRKNQQDLTTHWRIAQNITMWSYDRLGTESGKGLLEGLRPDGIFCDEAHRLKNPKAAVTRRVGRYLDAYPDTKFAAASGTFLVRSIKDLTKTCRWALGEGAPVPKGWQETEEFASALDRDIPEYKRMHPGALTKWSGGSDDLEDVRQGFRDRLLETPGVVGATATEVGASLYVRAIMYQPSAIVEQHMTKLRKDKKTPDGWAFSDMNQIWMYARQLAIGFHGIWDPRAPPEWLIARSVWAGFVREILSDSRTLDSPGEVESAVRAGRIGGQQELRLWDEIKDTFQIRPKDVWHDDTALKVCEKWMAEGPGIVWVSHRFFGHELSRRTGVPYFGQDATNEKGVHLQAYHDAVISKPGCIIASSRACVEGLDLQRAWDRNLITAPDPGPKPWEQLIGRTHRSDHRSEQVTVDVLVGCLEHWEGIQRALEGARATEDLMGAPQKLNLADVLVPNELDIKSQPGKIWHR